MKTVFLLLFAAGAAMAPLLRAAELPDHVVEKADGSKVITKTPLTEREALAERIKDARYEAKSRAAWVKLSATKRGTVDKLLAAIRAALPQGWSAEYVESLALFCIWREERVLARPSGTGLPLTLDEIRVNTQVTYFLRVESLVSSEQYEELVRKKAAITSQLDAEHERLRKMGISHRYDEFVPTTKAEQKAVARYEALKAQNFDLPDFSFENLSLKWDGIHRIKHLQPEQNLLLLEHRAECTRVRNTIASLMKPYTAEP